MALNLCGGSTFKAFYMKWGRLLNTKRLYDWSELINAWSQERTIAKWFIASVPKLSVIHFHVQHGTEICLCKRASAAKGTQTCTRSFAHPYLEVGELWVIEVGVDVQRGAHHQQRFKLVQRGADVASETETPDLQKSFQVKQHSKGHLEWKEGNKYQCWNYVTSSQCIQNLHSHNKFMFLSKNLL